MANSEPSQPHPTAHAEDSAPEELPAYLPWEVEPVLEELTGPLPDEQINIQLSNLTAAYTQVLSVNEAADARAQEIAISLANGNGRPFATITLSYPPGPGMADVLSAISDFSKELSQGEPIREGQLEQLLNLAKDGGAHITSSLGVSIDEIAYRYGELLHNTYDPSVGSQPEVREQSFGSTSPEAPQFVWIDVKDPDSATLHDLQTKFGLDAEAVADCLRSDEHARFQSFGSHHFVVLSKFDPIQSDEPRVRLREVHTFLGKNFVITVHDGSIESLNRLWAKTASGNGKTEKNSPGALFTRLGGALMQANSETVGSLESHLARLFDKLHHGGLDKEALSRDVPHLQSSINRMHRLLVNQRGIAQYLEDETELFGADKPARTLGRFTRSISDAVSHLDELSRRLTDALNTNLGLAADRMNRAMMKIGTITLVCLPSSAIGAIFGMNFTGIPYGSGGFMWTVLGAIGGFTAGLLAMAQINKWWR